MANDNKVNDVAKVDPTIFLPAKTRSRKKSSAYSLEGEFAKTRKNRDILAILFFIFFIMLIVGSSFYLIYRVQIQDRKLTVDISDFEDVNLIDILNTARGYEQDLADLRLEIEDIVKERDKKIESVRDRTDKQIKLLQYKNMKKSDKNEKIKDLKKQQADDIKSLRTQYSKVINDKREYAAEIESKISEFDSTKMATARQKAVLIDDKSQLKEIQNKKTVDKYERKIRQETDYFKKKIKQSDEYYRDVMAALVSKYNPVIEESGVAAIIKKEPAANLVFKEKMTGLDNYWRKADYPAKETVKTVYAHIADLGTLQQRLLEIPYENSVPDLLGHIRAFELQIIIAYETIVYDLIVMKQNLLDEKAGFDKRNESLEKEKQSLVEKNSRLKDDLDTATGVVKHIKKSAGYIVKSVPSNAVIYDSSDKNDVKFVTAKGKTVTAGQVKKVFRDGIEVGSVKFYQDQDGQMKAKIISTADGQKIVSFDRIVLE